jgi:AcrR family transcriptional regulator
MPSSLSASLSPSLSPSHPAGAPAALSVPAPPRRPRVRRGNAGEKASLVQEAVDIAFALYREGGIEAVSMRAVTKAMGLSATALYNHFADKSDLLRALWTFVLQELQAHLAVARAAAPTALDALRATTEAYLDYYERHPQHFRLLFMTEQTLAPGAPLQWQQAQPYRELLDAALELNIALARELGGDPAQARLARDLRHSLMTGYLHSRLINTRYAWGDLKALRAQTVDTIQAGVLRCLMQAGAAQAHGDPR